MTHETTQRLAELGQRPTTEDRILTFEWAESVYSKSAQVEIAGELF